MLECHIVRQLLPSYTDDLLDEQSKSDVAEHLQSCADCDSFQKAMMIEVVDSSSSDTAVKEIKYLARLKRKTIMTVLLAVTALLLLFGILFKFFIWGSPVKSGDIAVDAYTVKDDISGERLFLLDFELQNGKTLHVDSKMLYSPENEAIGVILTPRVVANNPLDNTGPEFQYGYHLDSNSNFRITVRYPDDKKVYDMREFSHS